jgi:hypothetical protein
MYITPTDLAVGPQLQHFSEYNNSCFTVTRLAFFMPNPPHSSDRQSKLPMPLIHGTLIITKISYNFFFVVKQSGSIAQWLTPLSLSPGIAGSIPRYSNLITDRGCSVWGVRKRVRVGVNVGESVPVGECG